jgi:hypothetical protein
MNAHRIEAQVGPDGAIHIPAVPFKPGEQVEVIILERPSQSSASQRRFRLRELPHGYSDPLEPACLPEDWDVYSPKSDAP